MSSCIYLSQLVYKLSLPILPCEEDIIVVVVVLFVVNVWTLRCQVVLSLTLFG